MIRASRRGSGRTARQEAKASASAVGSIVGQDLESTHFNTVVGAAHDTTGADLRNVPALGRRVSIMPTITPTTCVPWPRSSCKGTLVSVTEKGRQLRADAARNRGAILYAARQAFEKDGVFSPFDGIAILAGVGSATLYRNFPTRDDLLAALMEDSITAQIARGDVLAATLSPREALAEWMFDITWQLRIWNDLPACQSHRRGEGLARGSRVGRSS